MDTYWILAIVFVVAILFLLFGYFIMRKKGASVAKPDTYNTKLI
jgi:hypothetical protein